MRLRVGALRLVNSPPTNVWVPDVVSARTVEFGDGSQGVGAPVAAATAARRERDPPATNVKSPPRYTVVPSGETATVRTTPPAPGFQPVTAPVVGSRAARRPRERPDMVVKSPPAKRAPPPRARART